MSTALISGRGFDWHISTTEKKICAFICAICSVIPWIGYSIPCTMLTGHLIGLNSPVIIFGKTISGSTVLQTFAICVNLAELAFILLIIWKGGWYFWTGLIIMMIVSTLGSFVFHDQSQVTVNLKKNQIASYQHLADKYDKLGNEQDIIVEEKRKYINSLSNEESNYQTQVYQGIIPSIPDWIYIRKREAAQDIKDAMLRKQAYTDSMKTFNTAALSSSASAGYMVDFGRRAKIYSGGVAIFIECFLVFFGFLTILLFDSSAQDKRVAEKKNDKETISKPPTGGLRPQIPGVQTSPVFAHNRPQNSDAKNEGAKKIDTEEIPDLPQKKHVGFEFKAEDESAKVQTGNIKEPATSGLHLPQKRAQNLPQKPRRKSPIHDKICAEYCAQLGEVKQGLRKAVNETEIGAKFNIDRQLVDYHVRKENLK